MLLTVLDSPNQRSRPPETPIDTLILHYTGMQSGAAAVARLCDPQAEVSAHYVIEEDGRIFQLVPELRCAFHAGVSSWLGRDNLNDSSIGIELVNPGHQWGYRPFPHEQVEAMQDLCHQIFMRHPISPRRVLGHSDIAPDRKQDPGELFPWRDLARHGIGFWPDEQAAPAEGEQSRDAGQLEAVRHTLLRVGYRVSREGKMDDTLRNVLVAFQRHWRPELVDGLADAGTVARLFAVAGQMEASFS